MSKNKNNNNNLSNYYNFLDNCLKFNATKDELKKNRMCIKLLEDSKKINAHNDEHIVFYYGSLAEIYYYAGKMKSIEYGLSDGISFNVEAILDDRNNKYLNEIIEYKKMAFENYLNCINSPQFDIIKREHYDVLHRVYEGARIAAQDLCNLYSVIDDEENFLYYGKYAIKYYSLNAISNFIKYYCDKMDYNNALLYYNKMNEYDESYGDYANNLILKVYCYIYFYRYLYESGIYNEALNVARTLKKYILNNEYISHEYIKIVNGYIDKCKEQIENSKKINYDDILSKYIEKDIIDLMSDDNKIFISTSLNIYEYMKSQKITMDYSATLMPILKATENIIFEIIANKYHSFIMQKDINTIDKNKIRAFLDEDKNIVKKLDRLEYGKALSLIGYKNRNTKDDQIIINRYFIEFCNKNNIKNSIDVCKEMYKELDKLKNRRNLVAHKNRVYEDCVKECYNILLNNIKFIKFLYTNFRFVFEKNEE